MTQTHDLDALRAAVEEATSGPWSFQTVAAPGGTGFHLYLLDSTGRKIGVLWGKADEKLSNAAAILECLSAARSGLLDDAALGRAVRAAAERDGPERLAMDTAIGMAVYFSEPERRVNAAAAAASALIAMQEAAERERCVKWWNGCDNIWPNATDTADAIAQAIRNLEPEASDEI